MEFYTCSAAPHDTRQPETRQVVPGYARLTRGRLHGTDAKTKPTRSEYSNTESADADPGPVHGHSQLNQSRRDKRLTILVWAAIISVLTLVTLGGTVRITESGLGCPDWPLCHGRLIAPGGFHTWIEFSHRLVATVAAFFIFSALIFARKLKHSRSLTGTSLLLASILVMVEVLVGGLAVLTELPPITVTVHLGIAQLIFASLIFALVSLHLRGSTPLPQRSPLARWAVFSVVMTLATTLVGSYVVGSGASGACPDWPSCGALDNTLAWKHMVHRFVAIILLLTIGRFVWVAWAYGHSSQLRRISLIASTLLMLQIVIGAAIPWSEFGALPRILHLTLATALLGSLVAAFALTWSGYHGRLASKEPTFTSQTLDYLRLTKPPIIALLMITAFGGMFLAADGVPQPAVMLTVLIGGSLAAGGASALNHALEKDSDARMRRTSRRPVAANRVTPARALVFGIALNCIAFLIFAFGANLLSAFLSVAASVFYVIVYTLWLKRSTHQNIVIGGAAGAMPPVIGWAAVTGNVDLNSLYLFSMIFFWTPPHFWALALLIRSDYERANIPMLPVVRGEATTTRSILLHSILLVTVSLLFATLGSVGIIYLTTAFVLGSGLLWLGWRLLRDGGIRAARRLYLYSLLYLALLFGSIMTDTMLNI